MGTKRKGEQMDTKITKDIYSTVSKARDVYRHTKDSHDGRIVHMEEGLNRRYAGNGSHSREVAAMCALGMLRQTDNRLYVRLG